MTAPRLEEVRRAVRGVALGSAASLACALLALALLALYLKIRKR